MKRALVLLAALLSLSALAPATASGGFGLKDLGFELEEQGGVPLTEAGVHPFAVTTTLGVNTEVDPDLGAPNVVPEDAVKDIAIHFPPGLVGNPDAVTPCSNDDFTTLSGGGNVCAEETIIGKVELVVGFTEPEFWRVPLYNLEPVPGIAAKVGFVVLGVPVTIDVGVSPDPPHNLIALGTNVSQAIRFYGVEVSVWGNPGSAAHDEERGQCVATPETDSCPVDIPEAPFLTAPRSCTGPMQALFVTDSWQNPGAWLSYPVETSSELSGCAALPFAPEIRAEPTTASGSSASGLRFDLDVEDEGLTSFDKGPAASDIKKAEVLLPEGFTLNPSTADGLEACSEENLAAETIDSEPGEGCPQASKVGEVEVETPLLKETVLHGEVFVAAQEENPFGSMVALYMVIKDPGLGIIVKLPGRVELHPESGRVKTTFGEPGFEVPQIPFSHLRFRFHAGARAPLVTPPACGTHEVKASFTPWARPHAPYTTTSSFEVASGPGGGPCPAATLPFAPSFLAGSLASAAGSYSPFHMHLAKGDGQQELTRFSAVLAPGVTGKLAGIAKCPDAAIEAARQRPGRLEAALPSCPEGSRLGSLLGGAGVGPGLTWVPGSLYLAGPVGGRPLSIVAITPALAGPFDAGTVVVRVGLDVDSETAEVIVDGAASDPIPRIVKGIPLRLRDLRITTDRPDFTLTPTSCEEEQTRATLFGSGADALSPADDLAVGLASRYQASNCAALKFKPKLSLSLKGGTRRSDFPALTAKLTYPGGPGYANLAKASVIMPRALFLEQGHIGTVCTRVQFAADQCPAASVYGRAVAVTPLLDERLEGPVYLRSNGGERELPDLVAALEGIVDFDLVGYVDSVKSRLRTRFQNAPDVPVSSFTLKMRGGKKGLLVNSRNLCLAKPRARERLVAHNGMLLKRRPAIKVLGCKGKRRGKQSRSGSDR